MEKLDIRVWHDYAARPKKGKVEVRVKEDASGMLLADCKIPSAKYPLNDRYETFSFRNCQLMKEPAVKEIFDRQKYDIGHCYSNTKRLTTALRQAGFVAESYVGWLFVGSGQLPIHHCWTVLREGKKQYVLDLSDDTAILRHYYALNAEHMDGQSKDVIRDFFVAFVEHTRNWKHSERCAPLGMPFPEWYYVGCPCEPEKGKQIFNRYVGVNPGYVSGRDIDGTGRSKVQQMLDEKGLLTV